MNDKEKILYNSIDEIRNCKRYIKQSTQNVWGKNVIRWYKDAKGNVCQTQVELANWYISLPCNEKTYIPTLLDCFRSLIEQKENQALKYVKDATKLTCHQLCDWLWLTGEDGKIIKNGMATLVKYAVVLEDFEDERN
jgi:hypothetical protein